MISTLPWNWKSGAAGWLSTVYVRRISSVATPLSLTIRKLMRCEPSSTEFEFQEKDQSCVPISISSSCSPTSQSPLSILYSSMSCSTPSTVPLKSTDPWSAVPTAGPAMVTAIRAMLIQRASRADSSPSSLMARARTKA